MLRVALAMVPEVRQLLREDPSQLSALMEEIHDEDLADLLGLLDENEAAQILETLQAKEAAPIFERLDEETQEALVEQIGVERMAEIVSEMSADARTDLIEGLPDQVGEDLLESLEKVDPEAAAEVEELAKWPEDSAGGLMTTRSGSGWGVSFSATGVCPVSPDRLSRAIPLAALLKAV